MTTKQETAQDIMVRRLQVLDPESDVAQAVHALVRKGHSGAPVVDPEGRLLGVFTEYDCVRALSAAVFEQWPTGPVRGFMTEKVDTVPPDMGLDVLSRRFIEGQHRRLLVVEEGRLLGLISRRDLLRALEGKLQGERLETTYEMIARRR